jgi:Fur family peroxide stress response transcriptional regulator
MKFIHHPSADEIYLSIQKKYPGVSLATVYKTLDMLVQNKLASKVVTDEDKVRYDPRMDQHIHLYCEKTNKITDFEDPILEKMIADYLTKTEIPGFQIKQFQINIKGESNTLKKTNKV